MDDSTEIFEEKIIWHRFGDKKPPLNMYCSPWEQGIFVKRYNEDGFKMGCYIKTDKTDLDYNDPVWALTPYGEYHEDRIAIPHPNDWWALCIIGPEHKEEHEAVE